MGGGSDNSLLEDNVSTNTTESRRKGLGGSMSSKTKKLGRRLSRSMSIVALKIPEKAQNLTRSTKLMRSTSRDKKCRPFDLSIILPDKTQRQVSVVNNCTVAEIVCEPLREAGIVLAGTPSGPISAPCAVPLSGPLPPPSLPPEAAPPMALLFLGGSKAPVDPKSPAGTLEGEVIVVEYQPPPWDGRNLNVFIAWEKFYATTLFSAIELYGKPLLRAAAITKEEFHLLFYFLESVSEASEALTERMAKYIDSGLLINEETDNTDNESVLYARNILADNEPKSILSELVQEGILRQKDIDSNSLNATEIVDVTDSCIDENENRSSISSSSNHKTMVDVSNDCNESISNKSVIETNDNVTTVTINGNGHCCIDHRISADVSDNVWANVRWHFLNPQDFGYDQVRNVKRSRSDSALTPTTRRRNEELFDTFKDTEVDSCGSITPYESIEDLYDCIKNGKYNNEESSPSTESHSEPQYPAYYDKKGTTRQSSTSSEKSGNSSAFPFSKCGSSDSTSAFASCESTSGISTFISKGIPESLRDRELPPPPNEDASESSILLRQLFTGELMDAYNEYLFAYPHARALLRRKMRRDEHFAALADIRRGAAKYSIMDYLELPIERLAQYERLVGGGCARRRATRLSDLERVQDLFPHDYLALHDADAPSALASHHAQKTKSLRKRPSLDLNATITANSSSMSPRTFIMEAPAQLCPLGTSSPPLDRHLFLFSDLLLVGKSRGTNCFKLKESVRLAEVWMSLSEGDDTGFLIGWPTGVTVINYLATYPTQAARDIWYRKLQNALSPLLAIEPKSTNIQILYKDIASSIEFCKTVSVTPEMSAQCVVRQSLLVLQNTSPEQEADGEGRWGNPNDFVLCVRAGRDAPPTILHGEERPHAIQMSRIRQTLSNEEGFDLEHVNAKNNPCGLVFELRKKNQGLKNSQAPSSRSLRFLRRGGRLFGVSLSRVCGGAVPPALLAALKRLRVLAPHTHGVFRRSANAKALRLLRDKLDALGPWSEAPGEIDRAPILLLAALLKEFCRSLPQPLLLADLYPAWLHAIGLPQSEKVATVRALLLKLPKSHYTMLTYVICLLQAIAKKSNVNLMCPMNLGVCVGPSLLWSNTPCDKAPKAIPMVVELLIQKADDLFGRQINSLLGPGTPESNVLLDSGAEESDSLHSVGISLDSMELSSPRKEKLSLSRDSGLTLSEDDSNSNGGNSPAPRNILHSLSAPTCVLQEGKIISRYGQEHHNVNGLPPTSQRQNINNNNNIYSNKSEIYNHTNEELYSSPYVGERYIHNSINIGISNGNAIEERNCVSKAEVQRTADIYGQGPAKYITGLEPQKPPRGNVSKTARASKVYSMYSEAKETQKATCNKNFNRAKSSDNLLEAKQEAMDNKRDLVSSQENILYSNIRDLNLFTDLQRQNHYQHSDFVSNTNYSRVYTGWDKKTSNYSNKINGTESIYGTHGEVSQNKTNGRPPAATIFTRNDWTRQAARTKSLEASEDINNVDRTKAQNGNVNGCRKRRLDPAHLCTKSCGQTESNRENDKSSLHPLQNSYSYIDNINTVEDNKTRILNYNNNRLSQSKSMANIILQSDTSSGRTTESPASDRSADHCYTTQYIEPLYTSVYNRRRDIFHESDIYKATPTSVQPEYNKTEDKKSHFPPPVPPRKVLCHRILKKFPPVHVRTEAEPPQYRALPGRETQNVLALDFTDSDTESESYV